MHDNDQAIRYTKLPLLSEPVPAPLRGRPPGKRPRALHREGLYACTCCPDGWTANRGKVCDACLREQAVS